MKIGIDIDNTITSTRKLLMEYCIKYNDEVVKRNLPLNKKGFATFNFFEWTTEEEMTFCYRFLEEVVLDAQIKEKAQEVIQKLKKDNYIYIITSRKKPHFSEPYTITKKFLDDNNILYDELVVGCEDKLSFCRENNIDIMIDDEPQNINPISKFIPVIVFDDVQNSQCIGHNIIKVKSWKEVDGIISSLSQSNKRK